MLAEHAQNLIKKTASETAFKNKKVDKNLQSKCKKKENKNP